MGNVMTAGFWVLFLYISYLSDLKLAWLLPRSRRTTNAAVLCFRVFSPLFVLIETPHFFQLKLVCFHMCLFKKNICCSCCSFFLIKERHTYLSSLDRQGRRWSLAPWCAMLSLGAGVVPESAGV